MTNTELLNEIEKLLPPPLFNELRVQMTQGINAIRIQRDIDETIDTLRTTVANYKKLDEQYNALTERENIVAEKERNQKVFEAQLIAESAVKRANELSNLIAAVFKNPIYVKSALTRDIAESTYNNNTGQSTPTIVGTRTTETTTIE